MAFLLQVLRNKIGNVYRRAQRRDEHAPHLPRPSSSPDSHPELALQGREIGDLLERAIAKCTEENETWGRVLELLRAGRTAQEIQREQRDVPLATVHTRIHRARRRLREILRADFQVEV